MFQDDSQTVSFHSPIAINMVKILPLLALAAIVLKQNVTAVDLDEKQEWHPCKTDFINQPDPEDFTPPNRTITVTIIENC
jgi:hypothetical protein